MLLGTFEILATFHPLLNFINAPSHPLSEVPFHCRGGIGALGEVARNRTSPPDRFIGVVGRTLAPNNFLLPGGEEGVFVWEWEVRWTSIEFRCISAREGIFGM
ncbi:hypothetical protein AVEN_5465-1 [Araneus ventricosus]|uniref:Uncharacterized protein n=1 Tax=Araneus ventricosus TaxID=182803 RepID=A0A4Y2DW80_ARAVE|nr:hypothetical protein AVEN_5465-1 [Araneus ventricosus]